MTDTVERAQSGVADKIGSGGEETYSWLNVPSDYHLSDDLLERVGEIPERLSVRAWGAFGGEGMRRFFDFLLPTFDPEQGVLPMSDRALIAVVVSAENRCTACLLIHTSHLAEALDDAERARRISVNYRAVALSARERAIADLAVKITVASHQLEPRDLDCLREAGLGEREVFSVCEIASTFNFTNRLSSALGFRPDPEFFA